MMVTIVKRYLLHDGKQIENRCYYHVFPSFFPYSFFYLITFYLIIVNLLDPLVL
jgi:hypothetical protein